MDLKEVEVELHRVGISDDPFVPVIPPVVEVGVGQLASPPKPARAFDPESKLVLHCADTPLGALVDKLITLIPVVEDLPVREANAVLDPTAPGFDHLERWPGISRRTLAKFRVGTRNWTGSVVDLRVQASPAADLDVRGADGYVAHPEVVPVLPPPPAIGMWSLWGLWRVGQSSSDTCDLLDHESLDDAVAYLRTNVQA